MRNARSVAFPSERLDGLAHPLLLSPDMMTEQMDLETDFDFSEDEPTQPWERRADEAQMGDEPAIESTWVWNGESWRRID